MHEQCSSSETFNFVTLTGLYLEIYSRFHRRSNQLDYLSLDNQ